MAKESLLTQETARWTRGHLVHTLAALAIAGGFVFGWLQFWSLFWPSLMAIRDQYPDQDGLLLLFYGTSQHMVLFAVMNSFYYVCYKWDYLRCYKAFPEELWPWESMEKAEWQTLFRKTVMLNLFNVFVIGPVSLLPNIVGGVKIESNFGLEVDSPFQFLV